MQTIYNLLANVDIETSVEKHKLLLGIISKSGTILPEITLLELLN